MSNYPQALSRSDSEENRTIFKVPSDRDRYEARKADNTENK